MEYLPKYFVPLILYVALCTGSKIQAQPLFQPMPATATGIAFENTLPETPELNIITYEYFYNGGGVGAGDFNKDGRIDLYFTSNLGPNKLFINRGNFRFEDISKKAGVEGSRGWNTGVSVADVNGDGWLDIYVCRSGDTTPDKRKNLLFINNGDLTFTEKAAEMGLDDPGHSTMAAFFDMDRDGDLDACDAGSGASDCNEDGEPDICEIARLPLLDCDLNGALDSCQIAVDPGLDCNGNGQLDTCDIAGGAQDKDGDGRIDACELAKGDFNLDGSVNGDDLGALLALWGFSNPPYGDLNQDGIVNGDDLGQLLANWGPLP